MPSEGDGVVERRFVLPDAGATAAFGEALGAHLRAGDCVALLGEVGAGKTTLVRGLARGLGLDDPDAVSSPTYLMAVEHPGEPPLVHVDAYLPDKTRAYLLDGGMDYLLTDLDAVLAVEWAERIPDLLPRRRVLEVRMGPASGGGRGRGISLASREGDHGWLADWPVPPGAVEVEGGRAGTKGHAGAADRGEDGPDSGP